MGRRPSGLQRRPRRIVPARISAYPTVMRKTIFAALLFAIATPALPQVPPAPTPPRSMEERIESLSDSLDQPFVRYMADGHVPGLAWGIVADGQLAYLRTFGSRTQDPSDRVTPDTLVPDRLDVEGVHRARHPEAARRGPAAARRAGRGLCAGAAQLALSDQRSPRIRVRDLLSHVAGFVTDDPWGDRQQVAARRRVHPYAERGRSLHPRPRHSLRIFEPRLRFARPDHQQCLRPALPGLYPRRDHAPARHGIDRLRHRPLAGRAAGDRLALGE